jgi:hypothetical protein
MSENAVPVAVCNSSCKEKEVCLIGDVFSLFWLSYDVFRINA